MGARSTFIEAAAELAEAFRQYEPPDEPGGMYDFFQHVGQLPDVLSEVAAGMKVFENRAAQDWPLHPQIVEFIGAMRMAQEHLARAAEEIRPAVERHHGVEIKRIEAPRRGEHMWDTPRGGR